MSILNLFNICILEICFARCNEFVKSHLGNVQTYYQLLLMHAVLAIFEQFVSAMFFFPCVILFLTSDATVLKY